MLDNGLHVVLAGSPSLAEAQVVGERVKAAVAAPFMFTITLITRTPGAHRHP